MTVKCPNCGSSAQVKKVDRFNWRARGLVGITEHFQCGCGCRFNRKYQLYDIEIEKIEKRG